MLHSSPLQIDCKTCEELKFRFPNSHHNYQQHPQITARLTAETSYRIAPNQTSDSEIYTEMYLGHATASSHIERERESRKLLLELFRLQSKFLNAGNHYLYSKLTKRLVWSSSCVIPKSCYNYQQCSQTTARLNAGKFLQKHNNP